MKMNVKIFRARIDNSVQKYLAWLTSNSSIFLVICSYSTSHIFFRSTSKSCASARHWFYIYILLFVGGSVGVCGGGSCCCIQNFKQQNCDDQSIKNWFIQMDCTFSSFGLFNQTLCANISIFMHDLKKPMLLNCWPQYPSTKCTFKTRFLWNFIYLFAGKKAKWNKATHIWIIGLWWWECVCVHKIGFTLQNVNNEIWSDHIWFASVRKWALNSMLLRCGMS